MCIVPQRTHKGHYFNNYELYIYLVVFVHCVNYIVNSSQGEYALLQLLYVYSLVNIIV